MNFKKTKFKSALTSGYNNLFNFYPEINRLNVFPVPDGDTGTNMNLTIQNAINYINKGAEQESAFLIMKDFSKGSVLGARGNSGVILSQIFQGFTDGLEEDSDSQINLLKKCFILAKEVAYNSVMNPIEGTILTVIREISEKIQNVKNDISIIDFFEEACKIGNESLAKTPELLPILKEVGVVDSGGFGLMKFLEGVTSYLKKGRVVAKKKKNDVSSPKIEMNIKNTDYGYCTECIVIIDGKQNKKPDIKIIRKHLADQGGKSIVAIINEDIIKLHVHTLQPGVTLTYMQQFGMFKKVKVDNMTLQANDHTTEIKRERKLLNKFAIIPVVSSKALGTYFRDELNVQHTIVNAGMNPSTDDFITAIEEVDAKDVYILPNDSNVILAAEQAAKIEKKSNVHIVATKTIPEGMVATINFEPNETTKKNLMIIKQSLRTVTSVYISQSIKNTSINNVKVQKDDFISIINKKIMFANKNLQQLIEIILNKNISKSTEVIVIFVGEEARNQDVEFIKKYIDENFDVEYEVVLADQPLYPFMFSIE